MKARQFPYVAIEQSPLHEEIILELNEFLQTVQFKDVHYSGVSGTNEHGHPYVTGMVLVLYADGIPQPADIVQMKQFVFPTNRNLLTIRHPKVRAGKSQSLDEFLASHHVIDTHYAAVSGKNQFGHDYVTGLVLVVYQPEFVD
ncbi:MAG: hypothetical protein ABIJ21_03215 [Nanoarchaeota archaeon]